MLTRRDLGTLFLESKSGREFSKTVINKYNLAEDENTNNSLGNLYRNYLVRWRKAHYSKKTFEKTYASWLDVEVKFTSNEEAESSNGEDEPSVSLVKRGRPKKKYEDAKERTKKKIIKRESDRFSTPQAVRVLSSRLRRKGNRAGAACVKLFSSTSPRSSKGIYRNIKRVKNVITPFSPEEALSLLIDAKLTKKSYNTIRSAAKEKGANIYPSYSKLINAKKLAYPNNISTTEVSSEAPVQDLLHHTAGRIIKTIKHNIQGKFTLICKWGFDGSSGQSEYKQGWEGDEPRRDDSVFVSSMVPLKLIGENGPVWENPRPSSTRFCRPIRLQFIKETKEVITSEEQHITSQIKRLEPFKIEGIEVDFNMNLTMINGKALCALTGTSTLQCPICRQTGKGSTSWTQEPQSMDETALAYGISPLHAYIRFLEFVLAISYRLGEYIFFFHNFNIYFCVIILKNGLILCRYKEKEPWR